MPNGENENETTQQPEENGGYGGAANSEYPTRHPNQDARIERMAINKRWNIPDKYKDAMVNGQVQIAINPDSSNREKTSAFRALLAAEAQNQADEVAIDTSMEPASPAEMLAALAGTVPYVEEENGISSDDAHLNGDSASDTEEAV